MSQKKIPAVLMRGGASKGLFFRARDLPADTRERDALLLRILGSADSPGSQPDGMAEAGAPRGKIVILAPSHRDDSDVDYLFGAAPLGQGRIDWSGNCGNLAAAVGPFAIRQGWVKPAEPRSVVRIWQQNLQKRIVAHVPTRAGEVLEEGNFVEDGVAFPGAEITLEFFDPADSGRLGLLPSGNAVDTLEVAELGALRVTLINAGNPTVFLRADALRMSGREPPEAVNRDARLLARLESIRAHAALAMGLVRSIEEAHAHPGAPGVVLIAAPAAYRSSSGAEIGRDAVDLLARIVTHGRVHPGFSSTGSVALASAAALAGTVVSEVTRTLPGVPTRIGHPRGVLAIGASMMPGPRGPTIEKVVLGRSARRLMEGLVYAPAA